MLNEIGTRLFVLYSPQNSSTFESNRTSLFRNIVTTKAIRLNVYGSIFVMKGRI